MLLVPEVVDDLAFQSRLENRLRQLLQQTALARQLDLVGLGPVDQWLGPRCRAGRPTRVVAQGGGVGALADWESMAQAVGWDGSGCPVARTLLTYGQSSNPNSPYHADQTALFSRERWVKARYCERDILTSPGLRVVWPRERR
ncbi:hypothetical protein ADK55_25040 [Streptomyces sp. WM4235]|nr:penicillin acylase family protein [Streptomyces sp. WM4235]KOU42267.1 hypothetical protein ADK55_25040 [Streptomyces sp. WM4235]